MTCTVVEAIKPKSIWLVFKQKCHSSGSASAMIGAATGTAPGLCRRSGPNYHSPKLRTTLLWATILREPFRFCLNSRLMIGWSPHCLQNVLRTFDVVNVAVVYTRSFTTVRTCRQ